MKAPVFVLLLTGFVIWAGAFLLLYAAQATGCHLGWHRIEFGPISGLRLLLAVMLVVVNTVSALVHLYSIGYMHEDPHRPRFFAYLSLFTFAMLMLVTSDNLVQMFFGWEGVGLASYLLIGFWYQKPSAVKAAMKAFIVNRVGDFGFALGIFLVFVLTGSVAYDAVFAKAAPLAPSDNQLQPDGRACALVACHWHRPQ